MSLRHALKCKAGGWVCKRHHEVTRAWKAYFERGGCTPIQVEPYLLPVEPGVAVRPTTTLATDARADLVARGVFRHGCDLFADIAVMDTGADCYVGKTTARILEEKEQRKRAKYEDRVAPHGSFIPLVCSIYGTLGPAAAMTAHRVARSVDPERVERSACLDLHHVMIQTAVLKATSLCLRARTVTVLPSSKPLAVLPSSKPSEALEDAAGWLAEAGPRGEYY